MRYIIGLLLMLPLIMAARENPFLPAEGANNANVSPASDKKVETPAVVEAIVQEQPIKKDKTAEPVKVSKPTIHPRYNKIKKEVVNTSKARFVVKENSLYIETKDQILKHFSIANPPSIVIDFKAASDFASKRKVLTVKPFTKLEMGAHGDRYRVVLRLDKKHKYKIDKRKYGQVVTILK